MLHPHTTENIEVRNPNIGISTCSAKFPTTPDRQKLSRSNHSIHIR